MTTLEDLEKALRNHDWTYQYSDDPTWYRRGADEARDIERMMSDLTQAGLAAEAAALYAKHSG